MGSLLWRVGYSLVAARGLNSCRAGAWLPVAYAILVPQPGIEPVSPALEDGSVTIGPPGQSLLCHFKTPGGHCLSSWSSLLQLRLFVPIFVLSCFSCVRLFEIPWTAVHQAPLSTEFSRQEHWRGLPCPPPRDLPDPGTEPASLMFPALAGEFFTTSTIWEALCPY